VIKISTDSSLSLVFLDDSPKKSKEFSILLEQTGTDKDKDLHQLTLDEEKS